jgi:hypothetical protein
MKSRELFTDGWNSIWHVVFGMLSIRFFYIIPIFVLYQLIDIHDKNLSIDITEFFIGFLGAIIFVSFLNYHKIKNCLVHQLFLNLF